MADTNQDKSRAFFHQTLGKLRDQQERDDEMEEEKIHRMTSAYTSLNDNIKKNRDFIGALQDIKSYERDQKEIEKEERRRELKDKKILPNEVFIKEERLDKFKSKKEAFEKKTRKGKEKIFDRIMQEEKKRTKQESKQSSLHWMDKYDTKNFQINKNRTRKLPRIVHKRPPSSSSRTECLSRIPTGKSEAGYESSEEDEAKKSASSSEYDDDALLEPEYKGLWEIDLHEKDTKKKLEPPFISDSDMKQAMEKLRSNIVKKQVAAGREFKGQAFRSQPNIVLFKDFDVGKSYQKKVQLTNVSYTVNYCRFVDMSQDLKHFCTVEFDPPGSLSAGLTCWFLIKFTPLVDMDVDGSVNFLTQTGPLEVPVECQMKKCLVSLDCERLDLGCICKGEKIRRSVVLKNKGIIPTDFTIGGVVEKIPSSKEAETETPEASDPDGETSPVESEVMKTEVGEVSHIVCMNQSGHLAGYSECLIEFEFAPDEACVEVKDFAINFTQEGVEQMKCTVCAESTELSILLDRESLDMRICTVGCFYQDSIVFHNQAINSTNISTDIPSILDNTIRILPINALIQGHDKLTLHLQFTPSLALWNEKYRQFYNPETPQFEVQFNFIAKGLSLPLPFTLKACLTRAELSFDTKQINFGTCHMQESSVTKVHLTNHSLLPQKVGFINVPPVVEIRPSDGFLTLLAKETCEITIVFSPDKIKLYEFTLTCKSLYDKDYLISCTGKGMQSGLKLSHTRITFRDTVLDNFSFAKIEISNPKISRISSAKVRGVAPVNTNRIFHFEVPNALPIKITPEIGNLSPGEETKITIQFSPVILREDILELARELYEETMSKPNDEESGSRVSVTEKKGSSAGMMSKNSKVSEVVREEVNEDTPTWSEAKHKLIREFQSKTQTVRIPCFVSIATQSPTFLPDETLHLDLVLPSIAPKLFLKNVPDQSIEFGQCLIGMKVIRKVEVENSSDTELTFAVDPLDVHGPFEVLNAPRPIAPGKPFKIVFEFVPNSDEVFHEQCVVRYAGYHRLVFFLNAEGVKTELELVDSEDNPIGEELDVGDVVVNESLEFHLAIKNLSVLACRYYSSLAELDVGLNTNGLPAFDMYLFQGEIAPTSKREMKIIFTPDRPSLLYAEEISIRVNKKEKVFKFKIKGRAHEMNIHVHPDLIYPYDLMCPPPPSRYRDITKAFVYKGEGETVQKYIRISNVKHRTTGFKPNGEFHFELVDAKSPQKVFQIEPMKSTLEAGNTIDVKITFDHKQIEETHPVLVHYKLTLKGDSVKQHRVLLSGRDLNKD